MKKIELSTVENLVKSFDKGADTIRNMARGHMYDILGKNLF